MSLFDSMSAMSTSSQFGGGSNTSTGQRMLWGKVVSNEDPRMLGRIKVQIKEMMPWDRKDEGPDCLPWIYPLYPAGLGEGPLTSRFCVPEEESDIVCIFPNNSVYFGYYAWHSYDRKRRMIDFMSEYPERYGWQDSRENKKITNKDPDIDTIERRFADGGLSIYDSNQHQFSLTDDYGTVVFIDRKEQYVAIEIGGMHLQIKDGRVRVNCKDMELKATDLMHIVGKSVLTMVGNVMHMVGEVLSSTTKKFYDPLSRTLERLDRE